MSAANDVNQAQASLESIRVRNRVVQNWAGTHSCQPGAIYKPTTEAQVLTILDLAKNENQTIRAVGARHSPSDVFCVQDGGILVDMQDFKRVIEVDKGNCTIEAEAGILLEDLNAVLAREGLALPILPDISKQSLAGVVTTPTHGFGATIGCMATLVLSCKIVTADHGLIECSRSREADLFLATLCGLGLTGIITSLVIQCKPAFTLEISSTLIPVNNFDPAEQLVGSTYTAATWWPEEDAVIVKRMEPSVQAPSVNHVPNTFCTKLVTSKLWPSIFEFLILLGLYIPRLDSLAWHMTFQAEERKCGGKTSILPSVKAFNNPNDIKQRTYEGCVALDRAKSCLDELVSWLSQHRKDRKKGLHRATLIGLRVCEKDDIPLSPTFGQRGLYISATSLMPYSTKPDFKQFYEEFETILRKYDARPHWGKPHTYTKEDFLKLYPGFQDFQDTRSKYDPTGLFLNGNTAAIFQ